MSVNDSDFLKECRNQIEKKLNWVNVKDIKQSDFIYLSDSVYEKTKIQLSLSTIKRIWDESYKKSFQINTLNALAKFLDYQNWYHFKEKSCIHTNDDLNVNKTDKKPTQKKIPKRKGLIVLLLSVISCIVIVASIILVSDNNDRKTDNKQITDSIIFTSKQSVKQGVPNTIIFNYNTGAYRSDSLCIQLSWNKKEREIIRKENQHYTCTYYYPGYHHAKLIVDNDIIKEHNIHITTDNWLTLVRYEPDDVLPTYIRNKEVVSEGNMFVSPYLLKLNNVDLTANNFYVSYFNIKDFEKSDGDNFSFETKIKISNKEQALICQNCYIFIYAEYGAIVLPICSKGCVSDIGIKASDVFVSGKTNDLSGLGCDLTDWRKINGSVIDKKMKIFIDDKKAYEVAFNKSMGKIKGWHYFFKGCGSVDYLNVYDSAHNVVYEDYFKD